MLFQLGLDLESFRYSAINLTFIALVIILSHSQKHEAEEQQWFCPSKGMITISSPQTKGRRKIALCFLFAG